MTTDLTFLAVFAFWYAVWTPVLRWDPRPARNWHFYLLFLLGAVSVSTTVLAAFMPQALGAFLAVALHAAGLL